MVYRSWCQPSCFPHIWRGNNDKAELEAALLNAVLAFSVESPLPNAEVGAALAQSATLPRQSYQESMVKYREQTSSRFRCNDPPHRLVNKSRFFRQSILMGIFMPPFGRLCSKNGRSDRHQLRTAFRRLVEHQLFERSLLNEIWRGLLRDRYAFTQTFCTPIYAAWLEEAALLGEVKIPGGWLNFYKWRAGGAEWMGPDRGA